MPSQATNVKPFGDADCRLDTDTAKRDAFKYELVQYDPVVLLQLQG